MRGLRTVLRRKERASAEDAPHGGKQVAGSIAFSHGAADCCATETGSEFFGEMKREEDDRNVRALKGDFCSRL